MSAPATGKLLDFISSQLDKKDLKATTTLREDFLAFYHAITWSDKGFILLLSFHLLVLFLAISLRRNTDASIALFVLICGSVLAASYINTFFAAERWKSTGLFSQNYFDERGNFVSLFFSAPLLLIVFGQMVYSLIVASNLLIKVKRAELRQSRQIAAGGGGGGAATTSTIATTEGINKEFSRETDEPSKANHSSTLHHRRRNSNVTK
jgi:hypothetical protein